VFFSWLEHEYRKEPAKNKTENKKAVFILDLKNFMMLPYVNSKSVLMHESSLNDATRNGAKVIFKENYHTSGLKFKWYFFCKNKGLEFKKLIREAF